MEKTQSPFKVAGSKRRALKKEASQIKSFLKDFWHSHQLEKDMCGIYNNIDKEGVFPMSDDNAKALFYKKNKELAFLNIMLSELN